MGTVLETDRLLLRGWTLEDADSLYKYAKDPLVGPMAGWLPHKDESYSRAFIRVVLSKKENYAICLKGGDNEPIGSIGLSFMGDHNNPANEKEAVLGYWIGVPFWGNGYVPEAAREIIRHGFVDLELDRIYCGYFEGNDKSKRVQQKLGFKFHHVDPMTKVPMLDDIRTEYVNVLEAGDYINFS